MTTSKHKTTGLGGLITYPRWYLDLPTSRPDIPKGGVNRKGLTWKEWEAIARAAVGKPASMLVESWWSHAWAHGVDPTAVGSS